MGLFSDMRKVTAIEILNVEGRGSNVFVHYQATYEDGTSEMHRKNVRNLESYYDKRSLKYVECFGKVYCGFIKGDVRLIFIVTEHGGLVRLIQEPEGSRKCMELLSFNGNSEPYEPKEETPPAKPQISRMNVKPYELKTNELPQGTYTVGKDIPEGTFDFFVVYGDGGMFKKGEQDAKGDCIDGTWDFFWVGLKEDYEKKELIHVNCKAGEIIKITGNVIFKIVRSNSVKIDL